MRCRGPIALFLLGAVGLVLAAPHQPASDATVLERLPTKPADPAAVQLRELRAASAAAPAEPLPAARLARRYFEMAMAEGDPRYVGYAEAALARWPESAGTPPAILLLRGMLRQYRHDFARAMDDFALALTADPALAEARAWRAALLMVQADYAGARRECALLAAQATELQSAACTAYVDATTGRARAAYERLQPVLAARRDVPPAYQVWLQTRLAEMAWRFGDPAGAERHFRAGLALGLDDNFLLAAYADFLLAQGRPTEAARLLAAWTRSDTLLLRLALAARALGLPEADAHVRALQARFADAAMRGEKLHLQEEARFLLDLKGDARGALAAARENYRTQREPRDAEILLRAALAAGDAAAAAPALEWLETSGFEGAQLRALADKLKPAAK